tara:strand:- start:7752 stop:8513 length:762 start_codon:yes stop_codon:yes gene_type:complete
MNSVQENKNELEAAVRYCESAISRAQATIESMEFRQQAASKAWHEQTGREAALEYAVNDLKLKNEELKSEVAELEQSEHDLKFQYSEAKTNMALMTDEIATLKDQLAEREDKWDQAMLENTKLNDRLMISTKEVGQLQSEVDELAKAYKDSTHEEITMKKAWREQRELVALRDDQIAMLERRLAKYTGEKVYPFKEGDLYYVFNQLDGTWIESVWDHESERIHDTPSMPNHPHKVYFTIDQKHVLDKFKPEDD